MHLKLSGLNFPCSKLRPFDRNNSDICTETRLTFTGLLNKVLLPEGPYIILPTVIW